MYGSSKGIGPMCPRAAIWTRKPGRCSHSCLHALGGCLGAGSPQTHPCRRQRWDGLSTLSLNALLGGCPGKAPGATYLKWRSSTPAPGLCLLRSWGLHLSLGGGRTDSTRAALGVPQVWTTERRRWEQAVRPQFFPNQGTPGYLFVCVSMHVTTIKATCT